MNPRIEAIRQFRTAWRAATAAVLVATCAAAAPRSAPGYVNHALLVDEVPFEIFGAPGETLEIPLTVHLLLSSFEEEDVILEGWSLSLATGGWSVLEATVAGTIGADAAADPAGLRVGGTETTEVGTSGTGACAGQAGVVSAVNLDAAAPIRLRAPGRYPILQLRLATTVGPADGTTVMVSLRFKDGCRGAGEPVSNLVQLPDGARTPAFRLEKSADTRVTPVIRGCILAPLNLALAVDPPMESDSTDVPDSPLAVSIQRPPGIVPSAILHATVIAQLDAGTERPQGWALSVSLEGDLLLTGATVAGTAGEYPRPGKNCQGFMFESTRIVDPALDGQGQGAVSAVVVCWPNSLLPLGTSTVLALAVEPARPLEDSPQTGDLVWRDGLRGDGLPVANCVTVDGKARGFCSLSGARVTFRPGVASDFLRGDTNGDGAVDISDPIFALRWLFLRGPRPGCRDAADANDDGAISISDAVWVLSALFSDGPPPPAPFPACGMDLTPDELGCAAAPCLEGPAPGAAP